MVSDKFLHLGQHLRFRRLRYVAKHEYGCATFTLHFVFDWLPCNIYNHAGKIATILRSFSFHLLSESPHLALCTSVPWLKGRIQSEPSVTSARHPGGLKYFCWLSPAKNTMANPFGGLLGNLQDAQIPSLKSIWACLKMRRVFFFFKV